MSRPPRTRPSRRGALHEHRRKRMSTIRPSHSKVRPIESPKPGIAERARFRPARADGSRRQLYSKVQCRRVAKASPFVFAPTDRARVVAGEPDPVELIFAYGLRYQLTQASSCAPCSRPVSTVRQIEIIVAQRKLQCTESVLTEGFERFYAIEIALVEWARLAGDEPAAVDVEAIERIVRIARLVEPQPAIFARESDRPEYRSRFGAEIAQRFDAGVTPESAFAPSTRCSAVVAQTHDPGCRRI